MARSLSRSILSLGVLVLGLAQGCASDNVTDVSTEPERESRAAATIEQAKRDDPSIAKFFDSAAGYVVFPKVGKGGLIVGGGYGEGVVYGHGGTVVGYSTLSMGTLGAQIGGQTFKEVIFFKDAVDLTRFKDENFELDAHATAVAIKSGASATAAYNKGMVVFVTGEKGFMAEAVVGGQKFRYFAK